MTDPPPTPPLNRASVEEALTRIQSHIHRTPVLTSNALNTIASTPQAPEALVDTQWQGQRPARPQVHLFFKCENFQKIGAFKIRGASHALSRLSSKELRRGVVTHSSGNHAQALALAAQRFNTTAHIVMPTISTPSKIAATKGYGAHVYFSGSTSYEREAVVEEVIAETGAVLVPPYDHPNIILGQGTTALEMEEQVAEMVAKDPYLSIRRHRSDQQEELSTDGHLASSAPQANSNSTKHHLDALIAPLGGGGLLAGCATALHHTPTSVFGAEPSFQGADDGRRGLAAGSRIPKVSTLTIADGLRTPVGHVNWSIISDKNKVEGVYSVTEEQIKKALKLVMERLKIWVEPSAVVPAAVVLFDEGFRRLVEERGPWNVGIVISGGNVSVEGLAALFQEESPSKAEREEGKVGMDGVRVAENVAG